MLHSNPMSMVSMLYIVQMKFKKNASQAFTPQFSRRRVGTERRALRTVVVFVTVGRTVVTDVDVRNAVRKLVAVADVVRVTVLNTVDVARSVAVARAVEARPSVVVRVTVVV